MPQFIISTSFAELGMFSASAVRADPGRTGTVMLSALPVPRARCRTPGSHHQGAAGKSGTGHALSIELELVDSWSQKGT